MFQAVPKSAEPPVLDLDRVVTHTLPNGLRVRLLADATAPTVSYYTFFQVGSRNERPGITGISHLFEHMMFNGAKKYGPGEFDRVMDRQGASSRRGRSAPIATSPRRASSTSSTSRLPPPTRSVRASGPGPRTRTRPRRCGASWPWRPAPP